MKNEHLEVAKKAIETSRGYSANWRPYCGGDRWTSNPPLLTIYAAAKRTMEEEGMKKSTFNCFMVGRYMGELIEREGKGHTG